MPTFPEELFPGMWSPGAINGPRAEGFVNLQEGMLLKEQSFKNNNQQTSI